MRALTHAIAIAAFALLAIGLTWPLASHLHDAMIGTGVGDNATFVWNFWWIRTAIADGQSPFWTPALFAPIGTSLVLHTTTLLPTAAITAVLPQADALTAYNVALLATVFLNGICAYAAAFALTRQAGPAFVGGLVFAACPFLAVRLQGHFNVLSAWGLPLLVLATARFDGKTTRAALIALALAALAYIDYYQFIFGLFFVTMFLLTRDRVMAMTSTPLTNARRMTLRVLIALMLMLIVAIVAIGASGGGEYNLAGLKISARETFNLRGAIWLIALASLFVWKSPRLRVSPSSPIAWRSILIGTTLLAILLLPLIIPAARLIAQHDYASQTYLWRSAPPGIDVGSLLLGNPAHPLYGSWIRDLYARLGIHPIESVAWLGLVPLACLLWAIARLRTQPDVQRWLLVIAVFFVWSLGPFLVTFGANTGFILPQTLARYVPLLANARIPGRAFVMVILGLAMLVAYVLASLPRRVTAIAALLLLIDFWPAPQPMVPIDRPSLYATTLRSQPPGPVLDLPLGLRDGFGDHGHLDHRARFYQTLHQHPIAGGFVARLSPRIVQTYESDPILGPLLSGTATTVKPGDTLACAFRYLVLPKAIPPATRDLVTHTFQMERLDSDDVRDLFRITAVDPAMARSCR
jgi:hypothetical protein